MDSYSVTFSDGERVVLGNVGLTESIKHGRLGGRAFIVERVVFDSEDSREAWLPRSTGRYADGKPYGGIGYES